MFWRRGAIGCLALFGVIAIVSVVFSIWANQQLELPDQEIGDEQEYVDYLNERAQPGSRRP